MDFLRRTLRSVVRYDSAIYRTMSTAYNAAEITRCEGLQMARALNRLAQAEQGPAELLRFRNLLHPILVRPGTPDIATVINNIVREEYGQFPLKEKPRSMIDAGAYIGDSSAYFLSKYTDLEIVALEPDGDNHEMAQKNLAAYGSRVVLLNKALSSSSGTLLVSGTHDGAFISSTGKAVEATTVPDLMTLMGWQRLGILKMDIEGGRRRFSIELPISGSIASTG